MKQSKVAVIVINWNGEADSLLCIDALLNQSLENTIIAVDNGSTDNFCSAVETKYSGVVLLKNQKNLGFAGGANTGIRKALEDDFDFIALINNDALPEPNWLEALVKSMSKNSKAGIVTGKFLKTDGTIDSTGDQYTVWGLAYPRGRGENDQGQYDTAQEVFAATGGASIYRAEMFRQIGLFDEDFFAYYEDVDLSFRAQLYGWSVVYEPKAVAHHKIGASSGKVPGFTTQQTIKNLPWLLWKNVPLALLPKIWPRFFVAHSAFIGSALARAEFLPVFKGLFVSFGLFPKKLVERFHIQKNSKATPSEIYTLLEKDLPPNAHKLRKLSSFFRPGSKTRS